jgi:homoserine O-succinyltransferase
MPLKKVAETDLIRNLSNTPMQVELDLLHMTEHESKNTPREQLCGIMEWSKTNVTSTLHICWGAQAGLFLPLRDTEV